MCNLPKNMFMSFMYLYVHITKLASDIHFDMTLLGIVSSASILIRDC